MGNCGDDNGDVVGGRNTINRVSTYGKNGKIWRNTGAMVFTPYRKWHFIHYVHHQTVGDLDKRGVGDINTLTVEEYKALPKFKKLYYRLYRNPIILFLIAPIFLFTLQNRIPNKELSKDINVNTHLITLSIILTITAISFWIGFTNYLLIQIPILYFASVFGVWLFYVQHQFEDVVWERSEN